MLRKQKFICKSNTKKNKERKKWKSSENEILWQKDRWKTNRDEKGEKRRKWGESGRKSELLTGKCGRETGRVKGWLRVGREDRKWSIIALIWRHGTWALAAFVNEPSVLVQEGGLNQPWVPLLLTSTLSQADHATNTHSHTHNSSRMPLNLNVLYQYKDIADLSCFHVALLLSLIIVQNKKNT